MITELTRACPICNAILPDPASIVCARCGRGTAPLEATWPPFLKWLLLSELQVDSFHAWRTRQDVFEYKLRTVMNGCTNIKPNPWGLPVSLTTPVAELYPLALERAQWWRAAGSPIARRVLAPPSESAA
jgi:hypothetical protein